MLLLSCSAMFPQHFTSYDGLKLRSREYKPESGKPPAARVIIVHGLGDHSGSLPYQNLSSYLVRKRYSTYLFDLRGHGESEGMRMYTQAWSDIRMDVKAFVNLVRAVSGSSESVYLIGLSLGGLIALNYAEVYPEDLHGVVAAAPAVDASGVPALTKIIVPLLAAVAPRISINPGLNLSNISRNQEAVAEYTRDTNFQTQTTPRLAAEILTAMAETQEKCSMLRIPILILHGAEDTIVLPEGSLQFFTRIPTPDKHRIVYEKTFHNLFLEPNREQIFQNIVHWLQVRQQ